MGTGEGLNKPHAEADLEALSSRLGYEFHDLSLLRQALIHRSWCAEVPGEKDNERLEFLGDAVLGWVVADFAYRQMEGSQEGKLTDLRKSVVNGQALAVAADSVDLGSALYLGRGELAAGGRLRASILSDAFEATIGAIYLDGGPDAATEFVLRMLQPQLEVALGASEHFDPKTTLQELAARRGLPRPAYVAVAHGPDHARHFTAKVMLGSDVAGEGDGRTKKQAEQNAARMACDSIRGAHA